MREIAAQRAETVAAEMATRAAPQLAAGGGTGGGGVTGPTAIPPRRMAMDAQTALDKAAGLGWEQLEDLIRPALATAPDRPADAVLEKLATMWRLPAERAVLEWILDMTLRAKPTAIHAGIEETALAHAKFMAVTAVGDVIVAAIAEGRTIAERTQETR